MDLLDVFRFTAYRPSDELRWSDEHGAYVWRNQIMTCWCKIGPHPAQYLVVEGASGFARCPEALSTLLEYKRQKVEGNTNGFGENLLFFDVFRDQSRVLKLSE